MNIICIIQARMGSSRLPGKVMKDLKGKTVLNHVVDRVKRSKILDKVIVATTKSICDEEIVNECKKIGVNYYRGSEEDVLSRYYEVAYREGADIVVRVTSDCPLIDPNILDKMIVYFTKSNIDYLSNGIVRTFPRGFDVEVFTFKALQICYKNATLDYEKEHVTPYIYMNSNKFSIENYKNDEDYSRYRLTLDTEEDYIVINNIYKNLYVEGEMFYFDEIIDYLNRNPFIIQINSSVIQKKLGE